MIKAVDLYHDIAMPEDTLHILKGIALDIKTGESAAIVGASGSGKSTLLGILAGLDVPTRGQVWLDGIEITRLDEEARAKVRSERVAFVFQNFQLLSSLNALENVMLPLELKARGDAEVRARQCLARVGLESRERHYPHQLSGGEQQRVAIARAFACEAPIIFADEPTGNLDSANGNTVADLLFDLNREHQTTLILVTHSPSLSRRCRRRLTMNAGELAED